MNPRELLQRARLLWLRTPGVGPAKLAELERRAPLSELARATAQEWRGLGLDEAAIRWLSRPNTLQLDNDLRWLDQRNHHLLWPGEPGYPDLLAEALDAAPPLLVDGSPDFLHRPCIAVVGARRASAGGLDNARWFARELAMAGYTVVSGLAHGVDTEAHRATLRQGAPTIAVLGTGVDVPYPLGNIGLADELREHGALISEFALGTSARPESFPRRNRIISGLCRATLVVEASLKSGSLITARLAAEQNREVFAIPGSIHNELARGCHRLLRDGAALVESPAEIIELLGGLLARMDPAPLDSVSSLTGEERNLVQAMGFDPVDFDTLQQRTGLTTQTISTMLTTLVLKDRVADLGGGRYAWLARPHATG
ncbi:MAG: DNA-protecting protein DprA [Ahniella sp.]|nr:DNA-protecting protein DprA [Ahniella sp.]